jgi:SAM-dependent methyltransferase
MDRKVVLLGGATPRTAILEIGPSYNPLAPKAEGWNTTIVDHAATAELRAKYAAMGVDTAPIEDVDLVWAGGPLDLVVPAERHGSFGRILASHVIEHIPDLLGFLVSCQTVLAPDGVLALAVPDKRFCFDALKPLSTTGDILAARGLQRHSPRTLFQQSAYSVTANGLASWGEQPVREIAPMAALDAAWLAAAHGGNDAPGPYIDAHAWHFTPAWFRLAMLELADAGMIDWRIDHLEPSPHAEFLVLLRRGRPAWPDAAARDAARLALLAETLVETQTQIAWAMEGGLLGAPVLRPLLPPADTPPPDPCEDMHPHAVAMRHLLGLRTER